MIAQKPFKYKCPECGYSKIVKPKSDVVDPRDMINICPKCKAKMEKKNLNFIDKLFR